MHLRARIEFQLTGLSRGGQQVQKARETYRKALETLVELASLQVSKKARRHCEHDTSTDTRTHRLFHVRRLRL